MPQHGEGEIHRLMMRDETCRAYFPEWERQTRHYIRGEGFSRTQWRRFVAARSELNRILGSLDGYADVLKAYSWPVADTCRVH